MGPNKAGINLCCGTETHGSTPRSRQADSFPYTVVCRSASRILMLSWRGCRAASLYKKRDLGPVALWENRISCSRGIRVPPGCGSTVRLQKLPGSEAEGKMWEVFYLPIINSERDSPSLWNPLHSPSPLHLFLPMSSPPNSSSHTCFSPSVLMSALWFSYSSSPPLMPLSRSQPGLTWV